MKTIQVLKNGDPIVIIDQVSKEPSNYNCDKGIFIRYEDESVVWESVLGGTHKTPKERVLFLEPPPTPICNRTAEHISKEECLLSNGIIAHDLKSNNSKVLKAMDDYAKQFRTQYEKVVKEQEAGVKSVNDMIFLCTKLKAAYEVGYPHEKQSINTLGRIISDLRSL